MERKIGEIFEYNGEWYQCLEGETCICFGCDFLEYNCDDISLKGVKGSCQSEYRKDNKSVIFKKLEKVGEPYNVGKKVFQRYKVFVKPYIFTAEFFTINTSVEDSYISIEIKENKEDMEEKELTYEELIHYYHSTVGLWAIDRNPQEVHFDWICKNAFQLGMDKILSNSENIGKNLKPFDLEAAKAGKPVCTRDGRKGRIICFDRTGKFPIVALVKTDEQEDVYHYFNNGKDDEGIEKGYDLMMPTEKREGWVNVYHGHNGIIERVCGDIVSNTKEEALQYAQNDDSYITTVKIEWEE